MLNIIGQNFKYPNSFDRTNLIKVWWTLYALKWCSNDVFCFVCLNFQNWACNPQITATVHRLWLPGSSPNLRFSFLTALFLPFSTHLPLTQRSSEQQWWPSEGRRWHLHTRVSPSSAGWPASPTLPGPPAFPRRYAGHRPPEVGSLGCERKESTQMIRCIKSHKGVESIAVYKRFTVILL